MATHRVNPSIFLPDALNRTAMFLAEKNGVQVVFGAEAKASGNTIVLPAFEKPDQETMALCRGELDHEAEHIRITPIRRFSREAKKAPDRYMILNALENGRIEASGSRRLPGIKMNLIAAHKITDPEIIKHVMDAPSPVRIMAHVEYNRNPAVRGAYDLKLTKKERRVAEKIMPYMLQAEQLPSVKKGFRGVVALTDKVQRILRKAYPPYPQPDRGDGDDEENGLEGNEAVVGQDDSPGEDQFIKDDSEDDPSGSNKTPKTADEGDGEDSGEGRQGDGEADDKVPAGGMTWEDVQKLPTLETMLNQKFLKEIKTRKAGSGYKPWTEARDVDLYLPRIRDAAFSAELEIVGPEMESMAAQMRALLFSTNQSYMVHDQESGKLDRGRLAQMVIDPTRTRIFKRQVEAVDLNTAVSVWGDFSGSFTYQKALQCMRIFCLIGTLLDALRAVPFEIVGHTTEQNAKSLKEWLAAQSPNVDRVHAMVRYWVKKYDEPFSEARERIVALLGGLKRRNRVDPDRGWPDISQGNAYDGEAILRGARGLMLRPEQRKILVIITDASPEMPHPDQKPGQEALGRIIEALGRVPQIEPIVFIVDNSYRGTWYPDKWVVSVSSMMLGREIFQQLFKRLRVLAERRG